MAGKEARVSLRRRSPRRGGRGAAAAALVAAVVFAARFLLVPHKQFKIFRKDLQL